MSESNNLRRILITGGSGFIGTNYIEALLNDNHEHIKILNLDLSPPKLSSHKSCWSQCDLLDATTLSHMVQAFSPTEVVHLAARTDTLSHNIGDYNANTIGTDNLLRSLELARDLKRTIIVSTQFVKRPGLAPQNDQDFDPHTTYGESKVYTENATRNANLKGAWTIVRPTNIWGPWHPRYPSEFWRVLSRGWYFHPSGRPAIRSYGYVGNVIYQIERMLSEKTAKVDKKIFYVGDMPIPITDWTDGFSLALTNRPAKTAPRWLFRLAALGGDLLKLIKINPPISTSRYRSMTTDDIVPIERTFDLIGPTPFTLEEGISFTVDWLRQYHQDYKNK